MTLAEYMDPVKFPLTTQAGLTPRQQMMIDAVNYDDMNDPDGAPLTAADTARLVELRAKHAGRAQVAAEANAAPIL